MNNNANAYQRRGVFIDPEETQRSIYDPFNHL